MINQTEPISYDDQRGSVLDWLLPLITPIMLGVMIILLLFKSSSVTVNPVAPIVNVTSQNTFNPENILNITHILNITLNDSIPFGYFNSTWNGTNYFGNYTINNTYFNYTYVSNYTNIYNQTNYTYPFNNSILLNITPFTEICNVTSNNLIVYRTWCWT
jgi:hypothetical protein